LHEDKRKTKPKGAVKNEQSVNMDSIRHRTHNE